MCLCPLPGICIDADAGGRIVAPRPFLMTDAGDTPAQSSKQPDDAGADEYKDDENLDYDDDPLAKKE